MLVPGRKTAVVWYRDDVVQGVEEFQDAEEVEEWANALHFLYVANNGSDDVSAYSIDPQTGKLTNRQAFQPARASVVRSGTSGGTMHALHSSLCATAFAIMLAFGAIGCDSSSMNSTSPTAPTRPRTFQGTTPDISGQWQAELTITSSCRADQPVGDDTQSIVMITQAGTAVTFDLFLPDENGVVQLGALATFTLQGTINDAGHVEVTGSGSDPDDPNNVLDLTIVADLSADGQSIIGEFRFQGSDGCLGTASMTVTPLA